MRQPTVLDALLPQIWQSALSTLLNYVRGGEDRLTPTATWAVSALLDAGIPSTESPVRDYLVRLDRWAEQSATNGATLEESSTGLLGLWLYLQHLRRQSPKYVLNDLFLRSVEHNLQKRKALSLSSNRELLNAVAAGLGCSSKSTTLRQEVSNCLKTLSQNSGALEIVQMLRSWELIEKTGDIPRLALQHRLESIAADEDSSVIERAMAYFGQLRMAELFDTPEVRYEMRFLNSLGIAASSNQGGNSPMVMAYVLSLPYLKERISYDSLFDAWQRYVSSSFRRSKIENYLLRDLLVISIIAWIVINNRAWFSQLDSGFQVSIISAVVTVILMLMTLTAEAISELYGRQFWQKGKVELGILLLGALVSLVSAVAEALLK